VSTPPDIIATGQFCDSQIDIRASASAGGNADACISCETLFLSGVAFDVTSFTDEQAFEKSLPGVLALLVCGCAEPSAEEIARFVVVQSVTTTAGSYEIEVTILPAQNPAFASPTQLSSDVKNAAESQGMQDTLDHMGVGFAFANARPLDMPILESESLTASNNEGGDGDGVPTAALIIIPIVVVALIAGMVIGFRRYKDTQKRVRVCVCVCV
jgi:hypothetical protein